MHFYPTAQNFLLSPLFRYTGRQDPTSIESRLLHPWIRKCFHKDEQGDNNDLKTWKVRKFVWLTQNFFSSRQITCLSHKNTNHNVPEFGINPSHSGSARFSSQGFPLPFPIHASFPAVCDFQAARFGPMHTGRDATRQETCDANVLVVTSPVHTVHTIGTWFHFVALRIA